MFHSECENYRQHLTQNKKITISNQLILLEVIGTMHPNLKVLATICLTMNVTTASVVSFSHMRWIKARLWNRQSEFSFSHLMRICSDSSEQLSDNDKNKN